MPASGVAPPLPAPPLPASLLATFLLQLAVLLAVALGMGLLARRFGLPALAGELFGGVLLGPTVLGQLWPGAFGRLFPRDGMPLLDAASQLGVLLLVALTAARLDTGFLRRRAGDVLRVGLGALLLPLVAGIGLGWLFPESLMPAGMPRGLVAAFFGVVMCVTAIPVIAKTLADLGLLHRDVGQLILAAAALDDTAGWLLLAAVSALATGAGAAATAGAGGAAVGTTSAGGGVAGGAGAGTGGAGAAVAGAAAGHSALLVGLGAVALLAAAGLLGRPLARLGLRLANHTPPAVTAFAVLVTLLFGAAAGGFGLEPVLGAFLAGITVLRRLNPAHLAGLNTVTLWVFAPIFMAGIGLRIDLTVLASPLVAATAAAAVLVAIASKLAGAYLGARASRLNHWQGLALGAGMNSRGMVEVIIALVGLRIGLLTPAMFTVVVLIALVTSLLAPPMLRAAAHRIPTEPTEAARHEHHRAWTPDH